jgi:Terminase large subunit, T4likevirus-type, N-terminal
MLADLAAFVDPVALARRVDIIPDPWQVEVLRSAAGRILLNCSRQSGKSTVAGLLAVHAALYSPNSTTLLVSPGQRQSQELYLKARAMYRRLGRPVAPEAENMMSLSLENGSRIISLPGNESTVRTYTADLLIVDEASRVRDDDYAAYSPMLAVSGGRLLALSTPHGVSGWWSEAWHDDFQNWARWEVPATSCPRISPEFLTEERLRLGEWRFKQEYLCQFLDDAWSIFSAEAIDGISNNSIAEVSL